MEQAWQDEQIHCNKSLLAEGSDWVGMTAMAILRETAALVKITIA